MVFESLIVDLINRYLGSYIETLNVSQLKIGLLGGNAKLENLDIKTNAFDDLNLPVRVLQGHIGLLTLKIPFKNLYTDPTIAELDGLYVLVVPNAAARYDETKEKQYSREAKKREVLNIEEARAMQNKEKKEVSKSDSFGEKLAAQIVKNLQIDVKNVHIRYEDSHSIPGQIFSVGMTLGGLMFQTCDPEERPVLLRDESIREFYKFVKLTGLGIYWNHDSAVFSDKARAPLKVAMRTTIASPENPKTGFSYLLNPISSTAMLHVHTRPEETGFIVPQLDLTVHFSEIDLNFNVEQYHDLTGFLDATDRLITQNKYRKYRPGLPIHENYNLWWHYAYTCILEDTVRRRRQMWSWDHIRQHRRMAKGYVMLWVKHLLGEKFSPEQQRLLEDLEDALDVFNIVLCRQQAELQYTQSRAKRSASSGGGGCNGGWFSWFTRSSSESSTSSSQKTSVMAGDSNDLMQRFHSEMTKEEKARLYAAIQYSETGSPWGKFPSAYVSSVVHVTLSQLSFTLIDEHLSDPRILRISVNELTSDVQQRSGDQGLSVKIRLDSLEAIGARRTQKQADLAKSCAPPVLVSSRVPLSDPAHKGSGQLLLIDFQKNPLDRRCDQCIYVQADPLQFVYDAWTVNKIVHFLKPPKDIRLHELSSQVLSSLEDVKEITVSGLRHLSARRIYTEVMMDVKPSYFILPDTGVYRNNCRLLLVDLGSLTVHSVPNQPLRASISRIRQPKSIKKTGATEDSTNSQHMRAALKATFDELKESAYDKYDVIVSSVQVIMVGENEDWRALRARDQSPSHILRPLGITLTLKRCLLHNDTNLPKILLDGCLPLFRMDLTDEVLKSLFELVSSLPFPEPDHRLTTPEKPAEVLKDAVVLTGDRSVLSRDVLRAVRRLKRSSSESTVSSWFSETVDDLEEEEEDKEVDVKDDLPYDRTAKLCGLSVDSTETESLRTRASKARQKMGREAAMQRRRRANVIDFKVNFVIRTIQLRILKRKHDSANEPANDTVIVCLSVHDVGTHILKRRWDQELQAHIGTLSIAIPSFLDSKTKEPVCLAKTRRHVEGHHLLAANLLIAQKNAPDFEARYHNTRHHLRFEFKTLELCIHQEATLLLVEYFNQLVADLAVPMKNDPIDTAPNGLQWAQKVGDNQGLRMAEACAEVEKSSDNQLPSNLTAVFAIESHIARKLERRNIRLDAASAAARAGKTAVIRELNISQWLINATVDKVKLTLCSDLMIILSAHVHGLRLDVRTTYSTVEVSANLFELSVKDLIESTNYRKILWVDPTESIVALQLTHFTQGTELPDNQYDPEKVDMEVSLQLGKIHLIFLYHFMMRIVNFTNTFQTATEAVFNKVHALSDAAIIKVHKTVSRPPKFRVGLNIAAEAPVVYMPQHSFSTKALMIDFGCVIFNNRFELATEANRPSDVVGTIPEPGIMLEHTEIRLENLRLSRGYFVEKLVRIKRQLLFKLIFVCRAVLSQTTVAAEKPLVQPNSILIQMHRNLNPDAFTGIPFLSVGGSLSCMQIVICQGDYRVIQEVLLDNFAEVPPPVAVSLPTNVLPNNSDELNLDSMSIIETSGPSVSVPATELTMAVPAVIAVSFKFLVGEITLELFSADSITSDWHEIPATARLALCRLNKLGVTGEAFVSGASEVELRLGSIELTDTRPGASKQITKILDHVGNVQVVEELVYVKYTQDDSQQKKICVHLRSIHLCASMDHLLAMADFHLKSAPQFEKKNPQIAPITECGKLKRRSEPTHRKPTRRSPVSKPGKYPVMMEVQIDIGDPELVIVEDIYSASSNSLKLTATFHMQYTMTENTVIMDAAVKNLIMVACPYTEKIGGRRSKVIISRTQINYYSKQPINGSLHGSLFVETLLVNINPGAIQLLSHIASSLQSSSQSVQSQASPMPSPTINLNRNLSVSSALSKRRKVTKEESFWDPVPLDELNLPYLRESDLASSEELEGVTHSGCDVSKVLEQIEDRRVDREDKDIIVIRLQTVRIILESQVGAKFMPMLILELSLDGEVLSPNAELEVKVTLDLSLSYYNEVLNQWEQILETLPDDGGHMWSIQFEISTVNLDELIAEEDLDEVGCLQTSKVTILFVSRDNLELTLTKYTLDVLSNLSQSFEAAYKQEFLSCDYDLGGNLSAPYRIQNRTGWPLVLRLESPGLQVLDLGGGIFTSRLSKIFNTARRRTAAIATVPHAQLHEELLETDSASKDSKYYLLNTDEEIGYTEQRRASQKSLTLRTLVDRAPRYLLHIAWSDGTAAQPLAIPEASLSLNESGNSLLQLPRPISLLDSLDKRHETIRYPIVAQVTAYLGMRVISLRSTVRVINDTTERLCVYSRVVPTSKHNRPALLTCLEPGEIYALPVQVVNSVEYTGIHIVPEMVSLSASSTPAYWPEAACTHPAMGSEHELIYLSPVAETSGTSAPASKTLLTIESVTQSKPPEALIWPVQWIVCQTNSNSGSTYYYSVVTTNGPHNDSALGSLGSATQLLESTKPIASSNASENDFLMIVRNSVVLHNQLPIPINYVIAESSGEIESGAHTTLKTVRPTKSTIDLWFEYDGHVYRGKPEICGIMDELTVCTFESREGYELLTLHLGLRSAALMGQTAFTLYAPYWMVNKTGRNLTYKSSDDSEVFHPASFTGALLYSSLARSVFGKHKASLRVDDSQWSDRFSLDTVGSSGRVNCRTKEKTEYEIGVRIDLSSSGLTKIVTLMPYFLIVNKANINLECIEADEPGDKIRPAIVGSGTNGWIRVPAGEAVPFWPQATNSKRMLLRCRVAQNVVTDVFPYYESHSILMKLPGKYIGVFVEVETTEEATVIILQTYQEGMALVRIINHLGDCQPIHFQQRGVNTTHELEAGMSVMYAWDCARSERELQFYCDNDCVQSNRLTMDCIEEFFVNDTKAYWVSFLWNMQRVLLFTQDLNAAKNARLSADLEKIEQEVIVSLQSIGLSLVDNYRRTELAYLSVTSSGVRWSQIRRGNRLKPLKPGVSASLERAYSTYVNQLRSGEAVSGLAKLTDVGRTVEVDFNQMMMLHPEQCELRRAFEPGVFLQYKTSPSQMQVHCKIFRIQLDNQKMDCTFPVVLAPYPQPKSVALDSGPKPLVELSAIVARTADPGSFRFKYFRILVQEMQLQLDQGFLTDVVYFFGSGVPRLAEEEAFKRDYQLVENRLIDSPVVISHLQEGNRSVFDNLHISPIKMHVSFSLTGSTGGESNAFPSEVLNLFLQSLGVVLTDVQDVIFKLAYFERQACIMTVNQMITEMTRHYVSQGIRQMYVLVLGLDVLGNPFGVLRGMAQGVEDLFYEPVKGAVLGPEEFAEGIALGVKSLFGHAVGGAAGAVSRITGTIGKGVAALTLDEEYKRHRREQLAHRPGNFSAGLAQGGKGLVMGFFHGVSGVITKPVEGAKKDGFEGFFKGVGKGLVGAVTRPVSGVVDFASSSFEGIRRIAGTLEEIDRVRPPRYIRMDGVIRPYERRQAEGHLILRKLDKSANYGEYVHHIAGSRGKNVLVLTHSDVLQIESMDLLGTWSINWQTKLNALAGVPAVNRNGILFTLKERQKKLFGSGNQTRQFDCSPALAMIMVRDIDAALSKLDGWSPISGNN